MESKNDLKVKIYTPQKSEIVSTELQKNTKDGEKETHGVRRIKNQDRRSSD